MIPVHKSTLAMLLDYVSDEDITKIAKIFADLRTKDMTLILKSNYNLAAFLDVLEAWMAASSVSFGKRMVDGQFLYTISHDVGSKWSAFLSLMLRAVFERMGVADVSFEVTDGTILFGIPKIALRSK